MNYVDIETSANLDSTNAFEGPEKLLEVWLWNSEQGIPQNVHRDGLKCIPIDAWQSLLDLVSCKILSRNTTDAVDAYLLSESSLFVFRHKLILKTCGTTTTLACLDSMFKLFNEYLCEGSDVLRASSVHQVFYSRRSFMFPEKQLHVHSGWEREVAFLNERFTNGKAFVVGELSTDAHWHLYTGGSSTSSITSTKSAGFDQTLEILMTGLNPDKMGAYMTSRKPGVESLLKEGAEESDLGHKVGLETMVETRLDKIFVPSQGAEYEAEEEESLQLLTPSSSIESLTTECPDSKSAVKFSHDAFSFTPCGFSSNSVSSNRNGLYYTLHITPESGWSYASFETNFSFSENTSVKIEDVVKRVLDIFDPTGFSVTFMSEKKTESAAVIGELHQALSLMKPKDMKSAESTVRDLDNNYSLLYFNCAQC